MRTFFFYMLTGTGSDDNGSQLKKYVKKKKMKRVCSKSEMLKEKVTACKCVWYPERKGSAYLASSAEYYAHLSPRRPLTPRCRPPAAGGPPSWLNRPKPPTTRLPSMQSQGPAGLQPKGLKGTTLTPWFISF